MRNEEAVDAAITEEAEADKTRGEAVEVNVEMGLARDENP